MEVDCVQAATPPVCGRRLQQGPVRARSVGDSNVRKWKRGETRNGPAFGSSWPAEGADSRTCVGAWSAARRPQNSTATRVDELEEITASRQGMRSARRSDAAAAVRISTRR